MTILSTILLLTACNGDSKNDDSGGSGDGGADELVCSEQVAISCEDQIISDLGLQDDEISEGDVTTEVDGSDFLTLIDASAGGYSASTTSPWVYVRFTAEGAEKVEIDDETSLESLDWDLGLRRYLVRMNGGDSGPGCVGAVALREEAYSDIAAIPEGLDLDALPMDDFYTDSCEFIADSSGLEGSPNLALGQWWSYPGCVATSDIPFVMRTNGGVIIKLVVEQYYGQGQDECNSSATPGDDSGMIRVRWSVVE